MSNLKIHDYLIYNIESYLFTILKSIVKTQFYQITKKKTSYYFFLFNFMVYLTSTSSAVLTQNRWTVFKGRVQTLFWPQGHMSTDQVVFHELPLGLIFQYFQFQIIAETFLSLFTIHVLYELYIVLEWITETLFYIHTKST